MSRLITPIIYIQKEQREKADLNFDNEASREQRELAAEDLKSAKELFALSKAAKFQRDKSTVKGFKRKAVQSVMESTEHSFKAVNCADEDKKVISHNDLEQRKRLDKSHNLIFLQRMQE